MYIVKIMKRVIQKKRFLITAALSVKFLTFPSDRSRDSYKSVSYKKRWKILI